MRMVTIHGSKQYAGQEGLQLRLEASRSFHAINLRRRLERVEKRYSHVPDRLSVERAMLGVEKRIVEAFWVLARSTSNPLPQGARQHGIGYSLEKDEKWGEAVANGGWLTHEPRPSAPSAREIDASDEPLEWLRKLPREEAEVLSAGARSKRGDVDRRINWIRVRAQMPKYSAWPSSHLRKTYYNGLRSLAGSVSV